MKNQKIVARYNGMPHYQVYYWIGLVASLPVSVINGPRWYRFVPKPDLALDIEQIGEQVRKQIGGKSNWDASAVKQFVAEYTLEKEDKHVRFAIDAHDGHEIFAPELLDNVDFYFKANKWQNRVYPDKVLPLVNGNGFLRTRHLTQLRSMRDHEKTNDFLFISRIWGGVEHNVRLFEALAALPCRKRLVAIFVKGTATQQETDAAQQRLESVGVECTFDLFSIQDLWRQMASTKVIMLRAGKYMCIPWRMIDLLCMGSCIVTDADFEPQWPVPLTTDKHFVSCGILRPSDTSAAEHGEYEKVTDTIAGLLRDEERINLLRKNCIDYFDHHASPEQVGKYILSQIGN